MTTKKTDAKGTAKKKLKSKKLPDKQRDYEVGNCKPPKEHQFSI